jgi:L-fucose mutarotase
VDYTAVLMVFRGDVEPAVWNRYRDILSEYPDGNKQFLTLPKPEFYDRAKKAYCIVATSESEGFANMIIRKGVIRL